MGVGVRDENAYVIRRADWTTRRHNGYAWAVQAVRKLGIASQLCRANAKRRL